MLSKTFLLRTRVLLGFLGLDLGLDEHRLSLVLLPLLNLLGAPLSQELCGSLRLLLGSLPPQELLVLSLCQQLCGGDERVDFSQP